MEGQGPTKQETPDNESGVVQEMTARKEPTKKVPYKISDGKFPDPIVDLLQVLRRYWKIRPIVTKYGTNTGNNFVMPVTIQHQLANLYSSWAGSLHYRFVIRSDDLVTIRFLPYTELLLVGGYLTNLDGKKFYPAMGAFGQTNQVSTNLAQTTNIVNNSVAATSVPTESATPNNNQRFIDVAIPFSTVYEQLPTPLIVPGGGIQQMSVPQITMASGISPFLGVIVISTTSTSSMDLQDIFMSVGDDFRFYNYTGCLSNYIPYLDNTTTTNVGSGRIVEGYRRTGIPVLLEESEEEQEINELHETSRPPQALLKRKQTKFWNRN